MSGITLEDANKVIAAAIEKARELGFTMAIAVVDLQTSLVASARMDGTNPFTPDVVRGKAVATAVTKGTPSGVAAGTLPAGAARNGARPLWRTRHLGAGRGAALQERRTRRGGRRRGRAARQGRGGRAGWRGRACGVG